MINLKDCQYSVPPEFIDKYLTVQIYDGYLHIYDSTNLIALHEVSQKRLNYIPEHYMQIAKVSNVFKTQDIGKIAKENLKIIGQMYD